jgi:hypothetical protein
MSMRASRIQPVPAARALLTTATLLAALACARAAPKVTSVGEPAPVPPAPTPAVTTTASAGEVSSGATAAMAGAMSAAAPLVASLTSAVPGLSESQAALGAGALFALAQSRMPTGEYSQLVAAVPAAGALVGAAQDQGLPSAANLTTASVSEFLGKTGITAAQVTQLTGALGTAVKGMVPETVASSFAAALR